MATHEARERTYQWSDPREVAARMWGSDHVHSLRRMRDGEVPPPPFAQTFELQPDVVEEGKVAFTMPLREWMCNPTGAVHGGITATILDTVLTLAVMTKLPADKTCTTIDLHVQYVRPLFATGETIVAEGNAVHVGANIGTAEGRLHDARGRLIAHATATLGVVEIAAFASVRPPGDG